MHALGAAAVCLCLFGCAISAPSTETYIEQGQATLVGESVVIGTETPTVITASVSVQGERKQIAILASDCGDGIGSIRVLDKVAEHGIPQIYAFERGDRPPDQLFAAVCEIRRRKLAEKPHS